MFANLNSIWHHIFFQNMLQYYTIMISYMYYTKSVQLFFLIHYDIIRDWQYKVPTDSFWLAPFTEIIPITCLISVNTHNNFESKHDDCRISMWKKQTVLNSSNWPLSVAPKQLQALCYFVLVNSYCQLYRWH